jgi:uncharacterized membrane protein YdbT with pleckstrin-like domain
MKYVEEVLQPGEKVLFVGTIHWLIYLPGAALLAAGFGLWLGTLGAATGSFVWRAAALLLLAGGLLGVARAWFKTWTTEIAVTGRRIILKRGFIRRQTIEMNMEKVESVDVDQSIPGRIFGYGDVRVRGVGVGFEPLHMIGRPIRLRNAIIAR